SRCRRNESPHHPWGGARTSDGSQGRDVRSGRHARRYPARVLSGVPPRAGARRRGADDRWRDLRDVRSERGRDTPARVARRLAARATGILRGVRLTLLRTRGIRTALVTGKSVVTARMSVRHFGLDDAFDALEPGSPQGVVKAAAIQRLLKRWQL